MHIFYWSMTYSLLSSLFLIFKAIYPTVIIEIVSSMNGLYPDKYPVHNFEKLNGHYFLLARPLVHPLVKLRLIAGYFINYMHG